MTAVCDVVLMERASGSAQDTVIDKQDNVFISGNPPAAPASMMVDLSNGKVERLPNKTVRFAVDYKFTTGEADPGKTYRLVASLNGVKLTPFQVTPYEAKGKSLTVVGRISKDLSLDTGPDMNYELWLTEAADKNAQGTTVSNVVKGKVTTTAPDPIPARPQIQLVNTAVQRTVVGGKVAAATVSVVWKITAGGPNPKAIYTCVVELKGGKAKQVRQQQVFQVAGSQLQTDGQFSQTVVFGGETTYDMFIVELSPGQAQPLVVSYIAKGKIQ